MTISTEELISEQRIKYEALAARISIGKASQQEATDAIMQLCRDNERLAVIAGRNRAKLEAAEKLAEAMSFYADKNGDGYDVMVTNYGLSTDEGPIVQDGGDIARAALAAWEAAQ